MSNGPVGIIYLSDGIVSGQVHDGKNGLGGLTVQLRDETGTMPVNDTKGNPVPDTKSDPEGFYKFRHLNPGVFRVGFLGQDNKDVYDKAWWLPDGQDKWVTVEVKKGEMKLLDAVEYQEEPHIIERYVTLENNQPAPGRLVEARQSEEPHSVIKSGRTGKDGIVRLDVEKAGTYDVWVHPDPLAKSAPLVENNVKVNSVQSKRVVVPSSASPAPPPRAGGPEAKAVEEIVSYPVLTEEVGYPPSPLARPAGMPAPMAGAPALGQTAMKAISDVLGWQVKPDPKAFLGALNASFSIKDIEGHTEATWTPRTYAVQTDVGGGITGAQASVYARAKDALDQSLPLLDGLYALFEEAKPEDCEALRATVRSQFIDLVNEFGLLGGPRIPRVTQLFSLLLGGQQLPQNASDVPTFLRGGLGGPLQTDPDQIKGSLGNLRDEFGFSIADDQVNTVEDEQDLTNFRIVSDYLTSLAQTWLNNLQFFGLTTTTPFFGTQLVLLSRQLSVIAEKTNEVRFTLDSVFIGPADRQTLQINFLPPAPPGTQPMFLEDLLNWIDTFASEEGPRLIAEGGKFAVGTAFLQIATQLQQLVQGLPPDKHGKYAPGQPGLPPGFVTFRVRKSRQDLADSLQQLVNLAAPIAHVITPEPQPALSVLGINPNAVFLSGWPQQPSDSTLFWAPVNMTIIGTGFDVNVSTRRTLFPPSIIDISDTLKFSSVTIHSDNLASAALVPANFNPQAGPPVSAGSYTLRITMPNPDPNKDNQPVVLVTSFTVL